MTNLKHKKDIAQALYFQKTPVKEIAEKLDVAERTVQSWSKKDNWKERRAAQSISKNAIVQKLLLQIDELSQKEEVNADKIIKLTNAIEKIDKKNNVSDHMQAFLAFTDWLKKEAEGNKKITGAFIVELMALQDAFINQLIAHPDLNGI